MPRTRAETRLLATFGDVVRERRLELGLSQEACAHRAGMHAIYWGSIERGERNPGLLTMLALCRTLRCTPHDLLDPLV